MVVAGEGYGQGRIGAHDSPGAPGPCFVGGYGVKRIRSTRARRPARQPYSESHSHRPVKHPTNLHHVDEITLATMHPGDVILLAEAESLRAAMEAVFFAVLACPACGTLGCITAAQYCGAAPVICGSDYCSCRFRIDSKSHLVYLPAN